MAKVKYVSSRPPVSGWGVFIAVLAALIVFFVVIPFFVMSGWLATTVIIAPEAEEQPSENDKEAFQASLNTHSGRRST